MEILEEVIAVVFDWLRPHGADGPISRRRRWLRWSFAIVLSLVIVAVVAWLVVMPGHDWL